MGDKLKELRERSQKRRQLLAQQASICHAQSYGLLSVPILCPTQSRKNGANFRSEI